MPNQHLNLPAIRPSWRKFALGAAFSSMVLVCALGLGVVVYSAVSELHLQNQVTNQLVREIAEDANAQLSILKSQYRPACTAEQLQTFRYLALNSKFIGGINIHDENGNQLCSTLDNGPIQQADNVRASIRKHVTPEGFERDVEYDVQVSAGGQIRQTIRVRQGLYSLILAPFVMDALRESGASRLIHSTGGVTTVEVFRTEALTVPELQFLEQPQLHRSSGGILWPIGTLYAVDTDPTTYYVSQSTSPTTSALRRHLPVFLLVNLLGGVIGLLVYRETLAWLARRSSLANRVHKLLTPTHLWCHYQPLIDMRTGLVSGCEVLLRVRDGNEVIRPDVFIQAVVARGLTWEMDSLIVRQALHELSNSLPNASLKIALNLFPENIKCEKILKLFTDARSRDCANSVINLEVIEQEYTHDTVREVTELRSHGFLVSVDDFGTGFSNLGNVRSIQPDYLKIDRSFVSGLGEGSIRESMVPEIIAIGRAVGAELIAEGIETPAQAHALQSLGVEYAQGYLFCKPVPINEFVAFYREHGPNGRSVPNLGS